MDRKCQLEDWLQSVLKGKNFTLSVASADASFRRYFRVHLPEETFIAMDAPPEQESCQTFVDTAKLFLDCELNVPRIIHEDAQQGFLLLSDLGDDTYLSRLNQENAQALYFDATQSLIKLQLASQLDRLPYYDSNLLTREMQLLPEWYVDKHLNIKLDDAQKNVLEKTFSTLIENVLRQGQVYVHRDYHSRNLMVCENNPGILDFQDAVYGAITYD